MDFASPRFQGQQRLLQILNQPPSGTMHLNEGHSGTDVRAVQQALWDLCWSFTVQPPVSTDVNRIVDGMFGPTTTKIVKSFRTHFGLSFGGAAITGTVGTATLQKLDSQIVQYDASAAAIRLKTYQLGIAGTHVTLDNDPANDPYPGAVTRDGGVEWHCWINYIQGAFLHSMATPACYVIDPIYDAYLSRGYAGGPLGFPLNDTYYSYGGFRNDFQNGALWHNPESGQVVELELDVALREVVDGPPR